MMSPDIFQRVSKILYQACGLHSCSSVDCVSKKTITRHFLSNYTGYRRTGMETLAIQMIIKLIK